MVAFDALSEKSLTGGRLLVTANAKVNLALEVLGRRADGYHEIVTVMQAVDLCDRLTLENAETIELSIGDAALPADGSNLAWRAAVALAEAAGVRRGVRIVIDKRIPAAAGLGGGSSDAAATLAGLNRLWGLRWPGGRLAEVAAGVGSDVPFFLRGGTAMATGRGEKVEPIPGMPLALVLVNPKVTSSTADMYARMTPAMYTDGARARELARALASRRSAHVASCLYNGMEAAAGAAFPQVERMRAALLAAGALGAAMSGSGPTVFGLARSYEHARQIRARLARGSWACWAVRALRGAAVRLRAG